MIYNQKIAVLSPRNLLIIRFFPWIPASAADDATAVNLRDIKTLLADV